MKNVFIFLLQSLLFSSMGYTKNCQFELNKEVCADIKFKDGISRKKDSSFELQLFNKSGEALILKETPKLKLWMVMKSGHGHGSDELSISELDKENKFLVKNVWFMMLGQWDLEVEFISQNRITKAKIPICVHRDETKAAAGPCK